VHLHDNHGYHGHDLHHSLGTGVVDVAAALTLARAVGASIVLEHAVEAHVGASLKYLRARGLIAQGGSADGEGG
jgi:sugar phosphate isomerase/epimerase